MASATLALRPHRIFWVTLLAFDLILLVALRHVVAVAGLLAATAVIITFVRRPEWLLAFLLFGAPLLEPLALGAETSAAIIEGLRVLFFVGWVAMLIRMRRSVGRTAATLLGNPATIAVLLLALWLFAGLVWTEAPGYGEAKAKSFLVANVFYFLAGLGLWPVLSRPHGLNRFLRAGIVLGGVVAAVGLAAAFGVRSDLVLGNVGLVRDSSPMRLTWLGSNVIHLSRTMGIWLIFVLWGARRGLLRPILAGCALSAALFLLLRTGSRGPLVAVILSPLALALLPRVPGRKGAPHAYRLRRTLLAGGLIVLVAFLLLPGAQRERAATAVVRSPVGSLLSGESLPESFSRLADERLLRDPSALFRIKLVRRSLDALQTALPWGVGTGGFSTALFLRDFRIYPHNIEVEVLIENGLPGLLLFLLLLLATWRHAWRLAGRTDAVRWLWVLLAMALLNAQVSGDIAGNRDIWLWGGMIVGLAVAAREAARRSEVQAEHIPQVG